MTDVTKCFMICLFSVNKLTVKGEPLQLNEHTKSITSTPTFYPRVQAPTDLDLETFKNELSSKSKKRIPLKSSYNDVSMK